MIVLLLAMFAASADAPVDARIEDVAARPAAFDGQWLRLRGQIDQCHLYSCAICPEDSATGKAQADMATPFLKCSARCASRAA